MYEYQKYCLPTYMCVSLSLHLFGTNENNFSYMLMKRDGQNYVNITFIKSRHFSV